LGLWVFLSFPSRRSSDLSALRIGMPPATEASKATSTPLACAAVKISLPCSAISALLAVTICLPLAMACRISSRAVVVPPISSTRISTSGSAATAKMSRDTLIPSILHAGLSRRAPIWERTIWRPTRLAISAALRCNTLTVPLPTVPNPTIPTLTGLLIQAYSKTLVLLADDAVLAEHFLDASQCLAGAVLVLDQREAHMIVTVLAKADTR